MAMFKEMTDAGLIEAYWSERGLLALADRAGKVLRHLRNIDIIVAIGRKRGVSFARAA